MMTVIYNGKEIKVEPVMKDGFLHFFKGEKRNYYAGEVIYNKNDLPNGSD